MKLQFLRDHVVLTEIPVSTSFETAQSLASNPLPHLPGFALYPSGYDEVRLVNATGHFQILTRWHDLHRSFQFLAKLDD